MVGMERPISYRGSSDRTTDSFASVILITSKVRLGTQRFPAMLAGAQAPGLTASRRAPGSALFFEQQNRQPFIGIGEVFDRAEVEETELFLEPDRIEFSTDLHQDFLIFSPAK